MLVFMLRDDDTGLYSSGGVHARWVPMQEARVWVTFRGVSTHASMLFGTKDKKTNKDSWREAHQARNRKEHPNVTLRQYYFYEGDVKYAGVTRGGVRVDG